MNKIKGTDRTVPFVFSFYIGEVKFAYFVSGKLHVIYSFTRGNTNPSGDAEEISQAITVLL